MKKLHPLLIILIASLLLHTPAMATATSSESATIEVSKYPSFFPDFLIKKRKLNFIERAIYKMVAKKMKKMKSRPDVDADKLARQANLFGWLALGAFFVFPLASIPLGILAITNGTNALNANTSIPQKARTGRTTGMIALALVILALVVVLVIIAGFAAL